jgi:hypothetical protein
VMDMVRKHWFLADNYSYFTVKLMNFGRLDS